MSEPTSNCCGMSGFDAYSNCCGMSNFDDETFDTPTDLNDYKDDLGDDMTTDEFSFASGKMKSALAKLKPKDKATRTANRSARKQARKDKKAKKNSKRLVLFKKKDGSERFLFPLSKIKLGKKKYKDGTENTVSEKDQVKVTTPSGETATVDKKEVAKAMGVDPNTVTQADIQKAVTVVPPTVVNEQKVNTEVVQPATEPVIAVEVPEQNVESAGDGELYVATDLQPITEPTKDVKDEEKGLTKTQKIVLWSAVGVATILVGYIIYKSVTKNATKIN
jgi:hypothetical protein